MKNESTPTPQEIREIADSMTIDQRLQLEAIMNMMTALLISVYQTSKTERND
ncbi:MAG: hypothetical protein K2I06_06575 [Ruminococcus sp.]|nr:hypothetical protein [Ruminococcus sp.]